MKYSMLILAAVLFVPTVANAQSCSELRRACEMKDQLGERGHGNCRAYREQCQQPQVDCRALKVKCMFRDELGERGQGNCRAYRENCARGQ